MINFDLFSKIQNFNKLWSSHYWIFVLCLHVTNIVFLRFSDGDSGKVGKITITITHTEESNLRVSDYSLVPVLYCPPWKYSASPQDSQGLNVKLTSIWGSVARLYFTDPRLFNHTQQGNNSTETNHGGEGFVFRETVCCCIVGEVIK